MKTKINIAILIVVASLSMVACTEEEIKGPPTTQLTGASNTNTPIK